MESLQNILNYIHLHPTAIHPGWGYTTSEPNECYYCTSLQASWSTNNIEYPNSIDAHGAPG